jgi:hypothetical protein
LIPSLDDAVLLRRVRGREMPLHPLIGAVGGEFLDGELAAIVSSQHPKRAPNLQLRSRLDLLDRQRSVALGGDEGEPHEPGGIIHQ